MILETWSDFIGAFGNLVTAVYSLWKASHISRPNLFFYVKCIKEKEKTEWRLKVYNSEARKVFLYIQKKEKKQTIPLGLMYIDPLTTSSSYYDKQLCKGPDFLCEQIKVKDIISNCSFYLNFTIDKDNENVYLTVSRYKRSIFAYRYTAIYE